ncbi:MAG: cytochrome c [Burkholderiales bacterium]|nr:cytochrome c [Burkholderiales bacterium]
MPSAFAGILVAFLLSALACNAPAAADPPRSAVRGASDYASYCAPCHGSRGGGDGPLAQLLLPRPARHSDAAFMSARSDDYLVRLLKEGGPAYGKSPLMGAWGRILGDRQIRDLVAYMRSLPGDSARVSAVNTTASK